MFTGIVEGLGTIRDVRSQGKGLVFTIEPDFALEDPQTGESIAVNGVCLTATTISQNRFTADVSPETLSRTTLGSMKRGSRVNLERAVRPTDRLGGHIVSGHIDGVGQVQEVRHEGDFTIFTFSISQKLDRYIIEKGSIAIDGISLTVNSCWKGGFSVAIIPHTAQRTTMGFRKGGDKVNIEVDVIGKYIEKLLTAGRAAPDRQERIDRDFLAKHGFM